MNHASLNESDNLDENNDLDESTNPDNERHDRRRWLFLVVVIAIVVIGGAFAAKATFIDESAVPKVGILDADDPDQHYDYEYVIEPGTAERIEVGENIEVVPRELDVKVGQSIRIINNDSANHTVGLFYVPAEATLTQSFKSPGKLEGTCTVHPSGKFTLTVSEA